MPSFDVVSDFDAHEASNGVDQANREVNTRFDFKGTGSKFEFDGQLITLITQTDFQLNQMLDILRQKLSKRRIDIGCLTKRSRSSVVPRRGNRSSCARVLKQTWLDGW